MALRGREEGTDRRTSSTKDSLEVEARAPLLCPERVALRASVLRAPLQRETATHKGSRGGAPGRGSRQGLALGFSLEGRVLSLSRPARLPEQPPRPEGRGVGG